MNDFLKQKNLSCFVGNAKIHKQVLELLKGPTAKKSSSILFYGSNGVGKSTLCYQLAKVILSDFSNDLIPDHRILNLSHPDFRVLDSESADGGKITVDALRELISFMHYTPAESQFRVAIIDKADCMTASASNALLKILEEPPRNTFIFLIADQLGSVLHTLRSRCMKFRFERLSSAEFSRIMESVESKKESASSPLISGLENENKHIKKYNELYKSAFGSVTFGLSLCQENTANILGLVEEILIKKKKTLENIEYLIDAASNSDFGWHSVRLSVFHVLVSKLKSDLNDVNLKKRTDYLFRLIDRFKEVDNLNLDKKAFMYSILC